MEKSPGPLHKLQEIVGVECILLDGHMEFFAVHLTKNKEKVDLVKSFRANSIDDLKEAVGQLPISVSIDGRGILQKALPLREGTAQNYLRQALPQAKSTDFYLESTMAVKYTLISLCRKHLADAVIEKFQEANLNLIAWHLGPFGLNGLGSLFEEEELVSNTTLMQLEKGKIVDFSTIAVARPTYLQIGDEQLENSMLLAFVNGFRALLGESGLSHLLVDEMQENYFFKRLLKKTAYIVLGLLLVVLLLNGVLFQHYFQSNQNLAAELAVKQTQLQELEELRSKYSENQAFFEQNKLLENARSSYYADRIAHSLGDLDIQLAALNIFPKIKSKNEAAQVPVFQNKMIEIKGRTKNCLEVNRWNTMLAEKEWLSTAKIKDCGEDENGRGYFELLININ